MNGSSSASDGSSSAYVSEEEDGGGHGGGLSSDDGGDDQFHAGSSANDDDGSQWYFRYPRYDVGLNVGWNVEGPMDEGTLLSLLLDNQLDLETSEVRQKRFAEFMPIDDVEEFPQAWVLEAERRHTENTSLRELFLKFDLDGSCTIDRQEMQRLMEALQFPTPLNEEEFMAVAGPDGEIDFQELHQYLENVAPNVVDDPMWWYIDLQGEIEGPCPQICFRFWMDSGYFKPSTRVRHEDFPSFLPLGNMQRFPDDWLERAEKGEDADRKRLRRQQDAALKSLIWVRERFAAQPDEALLHEYEPRPLEENVCGRQDDRGRQPEPRDRMDTNAFDFIRFRLYDKLLSFSECLLFDSRKAGVQPSSSSSSPASTFSMRKAGGGRSSGRRDESRQAHPPRAIVHMTDVEEKDRMEKLRRRQKRRAERRARRLEEIQRSQAKYAKGSGGGYVGSAADNLPGDDDGPDSADEELIQIQSRRRARRAAVRENRRKLCAILDPSGFLVLNAGYTHFRCCTEDQVAEYVLQEAGISATTADDGGGSTRPSVAQLMQDDMAAHRELCQARRASRASGKWKAENASGEGDDDGGSVGIVFFIAGPEAIPCLAKFRPDAEIGPEDEDDPYAEKLMGDGMVIDPNKNKRKWDPRHPRKQLQTHEEELCYVVVARLLSTPRPYDTWVRIVRGPAASGGVGKMKEALGLLDRNKSSAGSKLKSGDSDRPPRGEWEHEIAEEEVMTLSWDMWQPAGTAAFYHLVRRAQQAPLRYK